MINSTSRRGWGGGRGVGGEVGGEGVAGRVWRPAGGCGGQDGQVPELPEVESLARFLRERAVGEVVGRVDVAAINVLKTYDPPVTALAGLTVTGATRHGKFLDLDVGRPAT